MSSRRDSVRRLRRRRGDAIIAFLEKSAIGIFEGKIHAVGNLATVRSGSFVIPPSWRSRAWFAPSTVLAAAGAVASAGAADGAWRALGIAALALGFAGTARSVLPWWRRFFLQQFASRLRRETDGTYLVRPLGRPRQQSAPYRIDEATKERLVTMLANGSVATTGLFVVTIFGVVAIMVIWQAWLAVLSVLLVFSVASIALQRRTNRHVISLIATGTPTPADAWVEPPPPPTPVANLRAMLVLSLAIPVLVSLVVALFFFDPDADTLTIDLGEAAAFVGLLIVLPLLAAALAWRELRRQRRSAG